MFSPTVRKVSRSVVMVAMWADSAVGSTSSAPSEARRDDGLLGGPRQPP